MFKGNIVNISDIDYKRLTHQTEDLMGLSDFDWGMYELSRDKNAKKLEKNKLKELVKFAITEVEKLSKNYTNSNIEDMLKKENIQLTYDKFEEYPDQPLFAFFIEPDSIRVNESLINTFNMIKHKPGISQIIGKYNLEKMILTHEFFHFKESVDKDEIFTKTVKIPKFKLGPINIANEIRGLSEYSAKLFSEKVSKSLLSSYIIEFIILNIYNLEVAEKMYDLAISYMKFGE